MYYTSQILKKKNKEKYCLNWNNLEIISVARFSESARLIVSVRTSEPVDAGVSPGKEIGRGRESLLAGYRLAQVRVARELQFGISHGSCRV